MSIKKILLFLIIATCLNACSTSGRFIIPKGTQLEVYKRPVTVASNGTVATKPFFWTAAGIPPHGGIPYRLLNKNGKEIKAGRLRTKFRVVSLFWPPFAYIYWPMGLQPDITYNLINNTQK